MVMLPAVAPSPMVPPSETRIVVAAAPLFSVPFSAMSSAVIDSVLPVVLSAFDAARVKLPAPLLSVSASITVAPAVVRLSFRVTPPAAFRVRAPAPVMLPVVASRVIDPAEVTVRPAAMAMLSLVSAALSASPSRARLPVSVVIFWLTVMPSSALADRALNVDADPVKVIDVLSFVATRLVVPLTLLLLAAVMPLTVILPLVVSPMVRPVAVMFWSSAPLMVMLPAVAPSPMVPPSETRMVVAAAPVLMVPVIAISSAVIDRVLPVVLIAFPLPIVKVPVPLLSLSASKAIAPAVVTLPLNVIPAPAFAVNPPVSVVMSRARLIVLAAFITRALNVDPPLASSIDAPAFVALSVTVPLMLLLSAALILLIVISPFVASPMIRFAAVHC